MEVQQIQKSTIIMNMNKAKGSTVPLVYQDINNKLTCGPRRQWCQQRSKQMLVVGDDKQVSPGLAGFSEEDIRWLEKHLPDIPAARDLLPESNFFQAFKIAFPHNTVSLREHYRCDPRIIAISNHNFYHDLLLPFRPPARQVDAVKEKVIQEQIPSEKKTNKAEANYIVNEIMNYVSQCCDDASGKCETVVETIGVISLGGSEQCTLIKKMIDEMVFGPLIDKFGSDLVDRHKILVGAPHEFQGDERDIVFLTTVDVARTTNKGEKAKLPLETKDSSKKAWNVALTRAKNKMELVRSYGIIDLHRNDFRRKILTQIANQKSLGSAPSTELLDSPPLVIKVKKAISEALVRHHKCTVEENDGVWPSALRVNSTNGSALVLVENGGESDEEWLETDDHQQSLYRCGRFCLRVDCLALALNFEEAFDDILKFLVKCRLLPSPTPASKRSSEDTGGQPATKHARVE